MDAEASHAKAKHKWVKRWSFVTNTSQNKTRKHSVPLVANLCPDLSKASVAPCVIVMVGLPARGKTYIAKKLTRYLNWIGIYTKEFNVGSYRRKICGNYENHEFFKADNKEAMEQREKAALEALEDLSSWIEKEDGEVAVFDATNTTRKRRQLILEFCSVVYSYKTFFVESLCEDSDFIASNVRQLKITSPDYTELSEMDKETAVKDFIERIKHYQEYYEPLDDVQDKTFSYLKIFNQGEKFIANRVNGHIQSRVVYYLMNIHLLPRKIYICRHGESVMNLKGRIGGDSDLTERGREFAGKLKTFLDQENIPNLRIWTSLMNRCKQTVSDINVPKEYWKVLNEIDQGICQGMTYEEIALKYPEEFALRDADKFVYRYPEGESYQDLIARLEPVIMELERQENVLVVCHQAVARCLLAYFLNKDSKELPYLEIPLHSVFRLTPVAYGCQFDEIKMNVEAVDTHRSQPDICRTNRTFNEAVQTVPPHDS